MRRRIAALSLVLVLVASIAGALDLPPLPDGIPPAVAKMNSALAGLLAPLKENRTALLKQAESFDRTLVIVNQHVTVNFISARY